MNARLIIAGLIAALAVFVTGPKIHKMAQLRGIIPGAKIETLKILEKWHPSPSERSKSGSAYWLLLKPGDIRAPGSHRINVDPSIWGNLSAGETIEVATAPGDSEIHLRNGDIFSSTGNFVFDLVLLSLEIAGATLLLIGSRRPAPVQHA